MTRVDPGFRYPAELPPPKVKDWPFVTFTGVATIVLLLGLLYMAAKTFGWLA
jgi:hypothetical protein